ncbi:sortase A [Tahibacter aquaticus]|uniref:Sortase A n=1 Tax=Tahibacter aquaticus TaxID=520092 RepID=A0A4R6YN50_9GAMM|nr:class GN sortase [Tahibacter aquaticus]TDR38984.1 sortase A [Tahibacter aquaticus]
MKHEQRRRLGRWLLLLLAGVLIGNAGYLHAKAWLAQHLLERAWQRSLAGEAGAKPWPWADTRPLLRLRVARLAVDQIVLAGDSGRSLAFGPAWNEASALPGQAGTSVISGHRDTHFEFLRHVEIGETIEIDDTRGTHRYRVSGRRVVDAREVRIAADGTDGHLLLVTCYPFDDWVAGGPLRYVVQAEALPDNRAMALAAR